MNGLQRWPLQVVADEAATRAEAWLEQTIRLHLAKALAYYRQGRPARGRYELYRLEMKLARFEGDHERVDELSQLRCFEPFRDRRSSGGGAAS